MRHEGNWGLVLKKLAAPAVVAMFSALFLMGPVLVGPASGPLTGGPAHSGSGLTVNARSVSSTDLSQVRSKTPDDAARQLAVSPPSVLTPAVEQSGVAPVVAPAAMPVLAPKPVLAPGTGSAPPEPPLIPPLSASPSDLEELSGQAPRGDVPGTSTTTPGNMTPEALIRDDNSAQIREVFAAINSYRNSLGLASVKYHPTVAGMAQEWSDNIATREVIEHRANFWTDPRAMNPTNGAGEIIAVRWDRNAAQLVEMWKGSAPHDAIMKDPRFNVIGIGITFTDGNWQTTPNRYAMWGVVNFFGYNTLPAGTINEPGGSGAIPPAPASLCDPQVRHMPPTVDLSAAAIKSSGDLVSVDASGQLLNRPSLGNRAYGAQQVIGSGFSSAKELFVTDWQKDGVFDVLTQWGDGRITLHQGMSGGGFMPVVTLGQSGWAAMTLAVGEWCANNRLPQLLALDPSGNLWLYPNRGTGDHSVRTQIASGVAATRLAMVDYDADGFQDLLARRSDGNVLLYRGTGSTEPRAESRPVVASGWSDVSAIRPLRDVTGLNSLGLALRRSGGSYGDSVQYWDLTGGGINSPTTVAGPWAGLRLAQ